MGPSLTRGLAARTPLERTAPSPATNRRVEPARGSGARRTFDAVAHAEGRHHLAIHELDCLARRRGDRDGHDGERGLPTGSRARARRVSLVERQPEAGLVGVDRRPPGAALGLDACPWSNASPKRGPSVLQGAVAPSRIPPSGASSAGGGARAVA